MTDAEQPPLPLPVPKRLKKARLKKRLGEAKFGDLPFHCPKCETRRVTQVLRLGGHGGWSRLRCLTCGKEFGWRPAAGTTTEGAADAQAGGVNPGLS